MLVVLLWMNSAAAVEVIVNQSVAVPFLPVSVVRSMFGMRQLQWPDGTAVRVFVLPEQQMLHIGFCREILNIYPYQLRQSWNRLVYSGTGQAPVEVATEEEMLSMVATTPGAIGYVNKAYGAVHAISVK